MAKYYVQSGQVQVVFDADSAEEAAVRAFQWWCDKQVEIAADELPELAANSQLDQWQLGREMSVSETGFGGCDAARFETVDVLMAWQSSPLPII